ncbi:transposase [Streptomyces sp. NPDC127074]|uniref:transposase n=1 Tax=Streptomyces sp. NPDC127074 TaxID=3347130 RepID=UPI003664941C
MQAVLRVRPVAGETTWSFLHRVAAAYGLAAHDLTGWWRWVNPVHQRRGPRPDGEVLLDVAAQVHLSSWCRVPAGHLAWALPSWTAGPAAVGGGDGPGRARWRVGTLEWGPVVYGCRLCAARHGEGGGRVWVYRARWRRLCAQHGRWLLDVGEGHPLGSVDVTVLAGVLGRTERRWGRVARATEAAGWAPAEVFALARAVVCGWWEREEFWAREAGWGPRLEHVVAAAVRQGPEPAGWGMQQWRLLVRDAVVFPEVVVVARTLLDPRVQQLAAGDGAGVRGGDGHVRLAAALGERLERQWLGEVEAEGLAGPLASWVQAVARERRRPAGSAPLPGRYGLWWVRSAHRPVEVGQGLQLLAASSGTCTERGKWRADLAVPRRAGHGQGLEQRHAQLFAEGLQQACRHAERFGHLALAHTDGPAGSGFDLGRWLANRRAAAASLTAEQAAQLAQLDPWWNPPWLISWQRTWYRARAHVRERGPVEGGDNLDGLPRWLRHQIGAYRELHENQRQLLAELGLTSGEVERYHAWPGRRRPAADGLAVARAYAARHGHLVVSRPTAIDGFALGAWLTSQRARQRSLGRPTRLGRQLTALDCWWNPPWPIAWQRVWRAASYHLTGLPHGCHWWPGAPDTEHAAVWLARQSSRRALLHAGQQQLLDELARHTADCAPLPVEAAAAEITDEAWRVLTALMPRQATAGGRWREHRQVLEGIAYTVRTGRGWRDLPDRYGPWQTCYRRYTRWLADGTLHRITSTPLPATDQAWQTALAGRLSQCLSRRA